jgi:pyruvate kinase
MRTALRQTKIICTIGPSSWEPTVLEAMIQAGMNVARINFSHGTHEEHARTIRSVRGAAERLGRPVAVLQDLAGPKVRIGEIARGSVELVSGARFVLTTRAVPGDAREVSLGYRDLPGDVEPGDRLLLSDGAIELEVDSTTETDVVCRVAVGGLLSSRKGLNAPSRSLRVGVPTDKDREDLRFGLEQGVDLVALSFVRAAHELRAVRELTASLTDDPPPLIAKIEKHEALERLDEILDEADGLMVARGDLGVEIPVEWVPPAQKRLIRACNAAAKPVITATQMLRSMVESPRPTRAEASDVANAVFDGSDAVMLSEESAMGRYPVEAVAMMDRLARAAEEASERPRRGDEDAGGRMTPQAAVAEAAARLAERIGAAAILSCTQSGSTTRLLARSRPAVPLLAMTPEPRTLRRLAVVWGAEPFLIARAERAEELEREAIRIAVEAGRLRPGDRAVFTAGIPLHETGTTNLVKVAVVE